MKPTRNFITALRNEAIGVGLIVAVWSILTLFYPAYIIPTPWDTLTNAWNHPPQQLSHHLAVTLYRVLAGFSLSLLAGTLLGGLAFLQNWGAPLNSLMMALQVLPGTVLGVILLLMCGIGNATPILLITLLVLPTLAVNTLNGLQKRNEKLEEYLISIRSRKSAIFSNVYLPILVPVLQSNLSLGMGLAVKVVVLGEFIGAQDGLGYLLNNARIFINMKEVFFYLLILLVFSLLFQAVQSILFSLFFSKYTYAE